MRRLLFAIAILSLPFLAKTENITSDQAKIVARNFYFERVNILRNLPINDIGVAKLRSFGENGNRYYVCDMIPGGFVIVSASNRVIPVLAYSFDNIFPEKSELPEGFLPWLKHYENQIEFAINENIVPDENISSEWQRLLDNNVIPSRNLKQLQSVDPLLVSRWNQDSPYNSWCPEDPAGPGGRCYAGCVATAMGQLLNYYRFPLQGQGGYTYTHPTYGVISADFESATYDWQGMPSAISKINDPIAELLFHQGVSVDMDYGPDGSGMWNHKAAYSLKNYFRYGPETQYYFRDSVTIDWDSLLVTNLNQRKPLYYAGWAGVQSTSGHAFVCDGYQPGNYYHFNWGWGGSLDGYFYTDNLTPGGSDFNFAQEVIPLFPDTIQNTYPNYCQGFTTLSALRGSIEDGSGWFNYQNNASCSWLIAPQDTEYDSIKSIKITFQRFNTESTGDTLFIYDGTDATAPLIGSFSGSSLPSSITSTGNKVFVQFNSNSEITAEGWLLDYESVFPVYCSGLTTLTSQSGSLEDGSGEKKYNSNSMCRWKITPAGNMPLIFNFTSFDTFDSTDIVKVYDLQTQEVLGTFTGNQLPPQIIANSGKMMIIFLSNSTGNGQGWSGNYFTSAVGLEEPDSCLFETNVYPNPTSGQISIEKFISSGYELNISVICYNGKSVFNEKFKVTPGLNKISFNLGNVICSSSLLIIDDGKQKEVRKIVINQ